MVVVFTLEEWTEGSLLASYCAAVAAVGGDGFKQQLQEEPRGQSSRIAVQVCLPGASVCHSS